MRSNRALMLKDQKINSRYRFIYTWFNVSSENLALHSTQQSTVCILFLGLLEDTDFGSKITCCVIQWYARENRK